MPGKADDNFISCDPVGSPHWSKLTGRGAQAGAGLVSGLEGDLHWSTAGRNVSQGWHPTLEQGKSVRSPPSEEEGVTGTMCDELTLQPPFPIPLCCWWGGIREIGSKIECGKKGRVGRCFKILFLLILLGFN